MIDGNGESKAVNESPALIGGRFTCLLFWDRLPTGVYEYTYLARAATIGTFVFRY